MKTTFRHSLLALAAFAALVLMVPGQAAAVPWCDICDDTGDCLACCRCDGGTMAQCLRACGYPAAPTDEVTLVPVSSCDIDFTLATPTSDTPEEAPVEQTTAD